MNCKILKMFARSFRNYVDMALSSMIRSTSVLIFF
jgi:hypothetical protein